MRQVLNWIVLISMIPAELINYVLKWMAHITVNISKCFHWCMVTTFKTVDGQYDVEKQNSKFDAWIESFKFKSSRKETEA